MKRIDLSPPEFGFIVATRAALGAGIGLLLSNKLRRDKRRSIGLTLVALGALTTIPAVMAIFGARIASRRAPFFRAA